jgi:hypothetical protein
MEHSVAEILRAEVERATCECQRTRRNLRYARSEGHGDNQVADAARLSDSAVEVLTVSLERLNQFIVHGIIPDDLKKPQSKAGAEMDSKILTPAMRFGKR